MQLPEHILPPADGDTFSGLWALDPYPRGAAGEVFSPCSPIDGKPTCQIRAATAPQVGDAVMAAEHAFRQWRTVPAPRRGELVRLIGDLVRENKSKLAELITLEAGKIRPEAEGEIQEWIDVCEFAVGLSRQLHGLTIATERPEHSLIEQWHPLGPVGVISAFNFPAAVWAWNAMIGLVCGDPIVWKPSEQTPLIALACNQIVTLAAARFGSDAPSGLSTVVIGGADVGAALASDPRVPLVSATGSVPMGRSVAQVVASRLGRSLLELGGNNGMIVTPSADLDMAIRAITFAAVGTCGQRCTSLRRLFVHESVYDELVERLQKAYSSLPIGDPREDGTLVGPLVDEASFDKMQASLAAAHDEGGHLLCGGDRVFDDVPEGGVYVQPAIVRLPRQTPIMHEETFAPLMYMVAYENFDDAIEMHNAVPQGLSSAIFTNDMREAHKFIGPAGSDCGLAGVNIGTSGAEIGGAFGGEKETGGGRESGSDSWKQYMRRTTCTINYGTALPLAQGIRFGD
ncbi:L-piperidine-6-carboxylate dehydrogenase [Aeoliella mucimassa]|uniref:Succinate-semialdehyde dehydrogenase [NADP(+)] GabD n=1 Tax=Aeoliella mucimassa TaxID=2527972 RepID=A0A518AT25_9BACT|nr:aldehyde dehydrogenase family protein [Aeoliella mucimassa]QDU57871.1 Succinate-semialdehyde dehydrogenase [NADP(+)] GabD [Aeoliella mucimassa]